MLVVIRTDASALIGTGHVVRCLTLADALRRADCAVLFVCRYLPDHLQQQIEACGHTVQLLASPNALPQSSGSDDYNAWLGVDQLNDARDTRAAVHSVTNHVDLLIVDHYSLDARWEERLESYVNSIMVIDDLANRRHKCDILLDQNLNAQELSKYSQLVPPGCKLLCGPKYALLREEFIIARSNLRERSGDLKRVFVFYGGVDPTGETVKSIKALLSLDRSRLRVTVVAGRSNPRLSEIVSLCQTNDRIEHIEHTERMAELMAQADLALGAGGTTTWERCFLGLPTIAVEVAENQRLVLQAPAEIGLVWNLGWHADVTADDIRNKLKWVLSHSDAVAQMSRAALKQFENAGGGVKEVVKQILRVENVYA